MASRIAVPQPNVLGEVRTPIQRNNANFVPHLDQDRNEVLILNNLNIVVIRGRCGWWTGALQREASLGQGAIFRAVEFMSLFLSRALGESLSGFRRQGRNSSIRPHNERGSPVPGNLGLEPVQPELGVIVVHILRGCAFYA